MLIMRRGRVEKFYRKWMRSTVEAGLPAMLATRSGSQTGLMPSQASQLPH
ncbi:hypothetical protein AK972_4675 [Pseudomonas yamanorum]|nr:hypothetical protein AK972_4675 [Pseudomonas yamanorum]